MLYVTLYNLKIVVLSKFKTVRLLILTVYEILFPKEVTTSSQTDTISTSHYLFTWDGKGEKEGLMVGRRREGGKERVSRQ